MNRRPSQRLLALAAAAQAPLTNHLTTEPPTMNATPLSIVRQPVDVINSVLGEDPVLLGACALCSPIAGALTIFDMPTLTLSRGGKVKWEPNAVELDGRAEAALSAYYGSTYAEGGR